jgi:1,2-diacylglycerol 3-beta-galactosyltransferase
MDSMGLSDSFKTQPNARCHQAGKGVLNKSASEPTAGHAAPVPLLFLVADTGGGHRAAARAISAELARGYPGRFAPVFCDPLGGPGSSPVLRWVTGLYGPSVRLATWLWGAAWHITDSRPAMRLLRWSLLASADRAVADAVARHRPAAIVSLHPLTGPAAAAARARLAPAAPLITVVTDLVTPHAAWSASQEGPVLVPTAAAGRRLHSGPLGGERAIVSGLPVGAGFVCGPASPGERAALRHALGLPERRFTVVLTGGGEGCGGMRRRAKALLRRFDDVQVVVLCGRNLRLRRRLDRLAGRCGGRLTVRGFTADMAGWMRCADVLAGKAGPGTIAEATCCGTPLLLTSQLPGQEQGNAAFVTAAGAGRYVPGPRRLAAEVARLRADPAALAAMRAASARLGHPAAASTVAALLAGLADPPPRPGLGGPRPQAVPTHRDGRARAPRLLAGTSHG